MEAASILNAAVDAASHAHPLPVRLSPRALEEQRVRALIARQPVAVKLSGLSYERAPTVTDVLVPKIRRSPVNEDVNPTHLDLTECWKGLSHSHAIELSMWYQCFSECLHSEVRTRLYESLVKNLLQSGETIDEAFLVPRMLECLRSEPHRVFDISFIDLIDSMMYKYYNQVLNEATSVAPNLSYFSSGLSGFLYNFIRMQDCFCDTPSGLYMEVDFDFQVSDSTLIASGNVAWQIPGVRFLSLPDSLSASEEYRITPFVFSDVLASDQLQSSDDYIEDVVYTIPRSPLSFNWDSRKRCFKAIVPECEGGQNRVVETVLCASMTTIFPNGIRFERQSRWSIKASILPSESNMESYSASDHLDAGYAGSPRSPTCSAGRTLWRADVPDSSHAIRMWWKAGDNCDALFRPKRKVSRPEALGETCNLKRRCRVPSTEDAHKLSVNTRFGGEMIWANPFTHPHDRGMDKLNTNNYPNINPTSPDHSNPTPCIPPLWPHYPSQDDSGFSSPDTPLTDSDHSAPGTTIETRHDALQQDRILRNYQEFADRRLRKDAGLLVSPMSEGERTAFESIFLEEGEGFEEVAMEDVGMGDI